VRITGTILVWNVTPRISTKKQCEIYPTTSLFIIETNLKTTTSTFDPRNWNRNSKSPLEDWPVEIFCWRNPFKRAEHIVSLFCLQVYVRKLWQPRKLYTLKREAKIFGFFLESPKRDSVKAATVQQRLVNKQLWPSTEILDCTVCSYSTSNRLRVCRSSGTKKLHVIITYSSWAQKLTQLRMSYFWATREAGFGPSFEEPDCDYNQKNKRFTFQAQMLTFTNQSRKFYVCCRSGESSCSLSTVCFGVTNM